ncbi:MAG: ribonuclease J [Alphaproteobacteria bacterium]|nr:ribonuclease J [Alphaproteobacteria bacterium]
MEDIVNFKEHNEDLLFIPLGGSNEIGINVNLYHYQGKWLMVDCGSGFADDYLPGVDMVVADMDFIISRKKDLLGIVLTHAHEDHLGAVQYFAKQLGVPIYATNFTATFLKIRLSENNLDKNVDIREVKPGSIIQLDPFSVEMIDITHSAPEMQGLMIRCGGGNVLHTGDWKFDPDPLVGPVSNEELLKKCGDEGVDALVCDSTNVFNEGMSGSEGDLRKSLLDIISGCKKMVVCTTFASNLARLDSLIYAGNKSGRKVILSGRSMHRMYSAAIDSGYLQDAHLIFDEKEISRFKREEVLVIATGCQGEPLAAVSKIVNGTHNHIKLSKDDTVIFSSKIIPGNEKKIFRLFNKFVRKGVEVITERDHFVHVSGHPALDELKRMYELVRPRAVIPVHGEAAHIHEHAKFARKCGIETSIEVENGSVALISKVDCKIIDKVETGYLAVDGSSLLPAESRIFADRRRIRDAGAAIITLFFDKKGKLLSRPVLDFPGCLDRSQDGEIIGYISKELVTLFNQDIGARVARYKNDEVEQSVKSLVKRILKSEIGKQPMIRINIEYTH